MKINHISENIENHRQQMINLANNSSLLDDQVLIISNKLDKLLNHYHRCTNAKK